MKTPILIILFIGSVVFLPGCSKFLDEEPGNQPVIITENVAEVYNTTAVFNARLLEVGSFNIIEYGFVWSDGLSPTIGFSHKIIANADPSDRTFSARVESLEQGVNYLLRAYIIYQSEELDTLYGDELRFGTIEVKKFSPVIGRPGSEILIEGANFFNHYREVKFVEIASGKETEAQIISSDDNTIIVAAPEGNTGNRSKIVVTVGSDMESATAESTETFEYVPSFEINSTSVVRGQKVTFTVYDNFYPDLTFVFDTIAVNEITSEFIEQGVFEYDVVVPFELVPGTIVDAYVRVNGGDHTIPNTVPTTLGGDRVEVIE